LGNVLHSVSAFRIRITYVGQLHTHSWAMFCIPYLHSVSVSVLDIGREGCGLNSVFRILYPYSVHTAVWPHLRIPYSVSVFRICSFAFGPNSVFRIRICVCRSPTPGYICYPCVLLNFLWERNPPPVSNSLPLIFAVSIARWATSRSDCACGCAVSCRSGGGQQPVGRFPKRKRKDSDKGIWDLREKRHKRR
jgi:hypothetical protein